MFSRLKTNWLYASVKATWTHHTQPIREVSQFIDSRPGLRFCRLVAEGFVLSEIFIAFKHYHLVGWTQPEGYYQFDAKKYGLLAFVPGEALSGQYTPAPFWRKEVGTILCNYGPDPVNEFIVAHEAGHSSHPWRLLTTISYLAGSLPTRLSGTFLGSVIVAATYWSFVAISERLADRTALKRCPKESLEAAARWFGGRSLETPAFEFPPDAHASVEQRLFLLKRRINQLSLNPDVKPHDLPLELPGFAFFGRTIIPCRI